MKAAAVLYAALAAAPEALSGECPRLPCVCEHGDETRCDAGTPYPYKGQTFGTCTACDSGWTGGRCETRTDDLCDPPCQNGAQCREGVCQCPGLWGGGQCDEFRCPAAADVRNDVRRCDGPAACGAGRGGYACGCLTDEGCGPAAVCKTGMVTTHKTKQIGCRLAQEGYTTLLKGNGVGIIRCEDDNGWAAPGTGRCRTEFFREQFACAPRAHVRDLYFYCEARRCSMRVLNTTAVKHGDKTDFGCDGAPRRQGHRLAEDASPPVVHAFGTPKASDPSATTAALSHLILASLALLVCLNSGALARRAAQGDTTGGALTTASLARVKLGNHAALCILLLLMLMSGGGDMVRPDERREVAPARTVVYECEEAACKCGAPKQMGNPACDGLVEMLLGSITSHTVTCVDEWRQCTLATDSEALSAFELSDCQASECAAQEVAREEASVVVSKTSWVLHVEVAAGITGALALAALFIYQRGGERSLGDEWRRVMMNNQPGDRPPPPVFSAKSVGYTLSRGGPRGGVILAGGAFSVPAGAKVAVMGPSGAGKTCLLKCLALRVLDGGEASAEVAYGGLSDSMADRVRYLAGGRLCEHNALGQGALLQTLTVRQQLMYSAELSLPVGVDAAARAARVDELAGQLDLEHVLHQKIGDGLSSGELKRVELAEALLAHPEVLLVDEPTSGLDAPLAARIVNVLTHGVPHRGDPAVAKFFSQQPVVLFSIHQPPPAVWASLQTVLLIACGRFVYCGPASRAAAHLEAQYQGLLAAVPRRQYTNDADYVAAVLDGLHAAHRRAGLAGGSVDAPHCAEDEVLLNPLDPGSDAAAARGEEGDSEAPLEPQLACDHPQPLGSPSRMAGSFALFQGKYQPRGMRRFAVLLRRGAVAMLNDQKLLACHALVALAYSGMLTALYAQQGYDLTGVMNRYGAMVFTTLLVGMSSMSVIDPIIAERAAFREEKANQLYSTAPYFTVKILLDFIFARIIPTACMAATTYFAMGFRTDPTGPVANPFLVFVVLLVWFNLVTTAMCTAIACVAPSTSVATLASVLTILFFFVWNGPILQIDSVPPSLRWMRWLSPFALAFEAILVHELEGLDCLFAPTDAAGAVMQNPIRVRCRQYLVNLDLDPQRVGLDMGMLGLWLVVYLLAAYVALVLQTNVRSVPRGIRRAR